jgi:uncharacterized protein (DUF2235 family)
MAKNIILCSDGTGNTTIKGRGTNVFKLFEAIDLTGHRTDPTLTPQIAFYDDGVGTEAWKPVKIVSGATGLGLARNVRQLYQELARVYDPGDRLFLFGFSRGAFTVRTLVDFIARCGILDVQRVPTARRFERLVDQAYATYRRCYRTVLQEKLGWPVDEGASRRFREAHCRPGDVPIAFVGVWDTVDAVGLPFHVSDFVNLTLHRFKFPDYYLSPTVERAAQALAIDDERQSFLPRLWHLRHGDEDRIEQVWFAGAHSNVGGGYPKPGLSLVALEWMMQRAETSGLRLLKSDRAYYADHANVDDKLYDPRAGAGVLYPWRPRDVEALCRDSEVAPAIHLSVLERIAHGTDGYAPGNLPPRSRVVVTPTGDPERDAAAAERARGVEEVLHQAHAARESLLRRVDAEIRIGRLSYEVFVASLGVALLGGLVWGLAVFVAIVLPGAIVSKALSGWVDRRMRDAFSGFWFGVQGELRRALKRARLTAARRQSIAPVPARAMRHD